MKRKVSPLNVLECAAYRCLCDAELLAELAISTHSTESQLVQLREQLEARIVPYTTPTVPKSATPAPARPLKDRSDLTNDLLMRFTDEQISHILEFGFEAVQKIPVSLQNSMDDTDAEQTAKLFTEFMEGR